MMRSGEEEEEHWDLISKFLYNEKSKSNKCTMQTQGLSVQSIHRL